MFEVGDRVQFSLGRLKRQGVILRLSDGVAQVGTLGHVLAIEEDRLTAVEKPPPTASGPAQPTAPENSLAAGFSDVARDISLKVDQLETERNQVLENLPAVGAQTKVPPDPA